MLTEAEIMEIDRLANEAEDLIGATNLTLAILPAIKAYVDKNRDGSIAGELDTLAFKLGSLYGRLIAGQYSWHWVHITDGTYNAYGVASANGQFCCQVHHYLHMLITTEKPNNIILLFNMIEALSYQDIQHGKYIFLS